MKNLTATQQNRTSPKKSLIAILILLVWLVVLSAVVYNRQGIYDSIKLRNYTASPTVSGLATDDTMTAAARRVFYVNDPQVADKEPFASNCPTGTEQSVVLGCYHGNQDGIYVLKVSDPRLNGVEQVTAAHELLHAEYDRLSSRQKESIDAMLQDYYQHGLTDDIVKAQIADYQKTEPNDVTNEMHSLFGTEIANLPPQLEQYYEQYFTNRQAITDLYTQYQAEFTGRQNQIKAYDSQLTTMKNQIKSDEKSLAAQNSSLDTRRAQLNADRNSGNIANYNAAVPGYNAAVNAYNAAAQSLRQQIASYNALVVTRNALAAETNELTAEISIPAYS